MSNDNNDNNGCTDLNDLHREKGLDAVAEQLKNAVPPESSAPPDLEAGEAVAAVNNIEKPTIDSVLRRYAYVMPDGKIWDSHSMKFVKVGAFKSFITPAIYSEWINHDERRSVNADDVSDLAATAQVASVGGLSQALDRYVYLNPSSTAWDCVDRDIVALADLRFAIADCFDHWLKHPNRKEIPKRNLVFDPTQSVVKDDHINRFRGLPLKPKRNDHGCENILRMMYSLCNEDKEVFNWLANWLAYPLQNVGAKMDTAVLMHSDVHGSGKSLFFEGVMSRIYGEYSRTFGQAQLESQYNDWMSACLFGVFEEVLSRSQKYSHTGTVKQMITGNKLWVEKKYVSGWEEANHMNSVFLSNEVQPLPIEPSDRRFLIIWPEAKLLLEFQNGVQAELENGGAEAFYAWLLSRDLTGFNQRSKPPITDAKRRLIDFGRPSWEVFFDEWKNGELDVCFCSCLVSQLFKVFCRWCSERKEHPVSQNKFSGFIATKAKRRRDVHYQINGQDKKGIIFEVGQKTEKQTKGEWIGQCISEFDRVLNGWASNEEQ